MFDLAKARKVAAEYRQRQDAAEGPVVSLYLELFWGNDFDGTGCRVIGFSRRIDRYDIPVPCSIYYPEPDWMLNIDVTECDVFFGFDGIPCEIQYKCKPMGMDTSSKDEVDETIREMELGGWSKGSLVGNNARNSDIGHQLEAACNALDAHRALLLRLANEAHMRQDYNTNEEICRLLGVPSALEHEKGDL